MARFKKRQSVYMIRKDEETQTLIDEIWLVGDREARLGGKRKEWLHRHFVDPDLMIDSNELDMIMSLHLKYVRGRTKESPGLVGGKKFGMRKKSA